MAKTSDNESSPPNGNSSSDSPVSDDSSTTTIPAEDYEDDSSPSPPPPSSSPPPPSKDSSPPPPDNKDSPPSDNNNNNNNNNSPSPPSGNDNKSPPPPSGNDNKSPPPPSGNDNKSPPPPSGDNENKSPPPPSGNNNNHSPPPPSGNNGNNNPPPDNNNNNNNNQTPPSPQSNNHDKSPTPPNSHDSSMGAGSPPPPLSSATNHSGALAPPKAKSSSSSHHTSVKDDSGAPSKEMIIGVAAGVGLLLLVMIVLVISCCRRKKRKPHNQMHYYDGSQGNRPNDYYNTSGGPWRHQGPPSDHVVKMPMPHSAAVSSEHGWQAGPPPPPPPMMSSSELSSAAFSGPFQAPPPPPPGMALGMNQSNFSYDDLAAATAGFAQSNLLGQGGFGYVHKGVLPNGLEVAVKSLKSNSGQGEREFQAEVDIISRVHHKHLVSLVGYCIAGSQRMLVYEFVPNKTLEYHLYGVGRPTMDWPTRIRIALGSAKGFAYLHEDCHPRIIHRDIKAANILLDDNMEAKVADFGLAKLSSDTHTHVSTRIMGTFGYLAPEYASSGKLTEKSDVYSYGVMLLELITGRRPIDMSRDDDDSLIDWARPILTRVMDGGSYEELVDPRLESNYEPQEMLRLVACAAACIRHSARRRPKMSQIVRALEGDVSLEDLNEGVKPGHSSVFGSSGSSEYDANSYNTDVKKFRKTGLSSQEFTSSEHGTGEFVRSVGDSQEMRPNGTRGMRNNP